MSVCVCDFFYVYMLRFVQRGGELRCQKFVSDGTRNFPSVCVSVCLRTMHTHFLTHSHAYIQPHTHKHTASHVRTEARVFSQRCT